MSLFLTQAVVKDTNTDLTLPSLPASRLYHRNTSIKDGQEPG